MKRAYLIGSPVAHSLSPALHNSAFAALGIEARYDLLETPPGALAFALERIAADDCIGANVTVPHKQAIIPYLHGLDESASQVGAVNTLVKQNGRIVGANTDVEGMVRALDDAGVNLKGTRAFVLGAGGAARAVAFALAKRQVAKITIVNRTEEHVVSLQQTVSRQYPDIEIAVNQLTDIKQAHMVINATSVGMAPTSDETPLPPGCAVLRGAVAFDLVYLPRETRFLKEARKAGARTVEGLGMLVHQGRASFRLWTDREAPDARSLYVAILNGG